MLLGNRTITPTKSKPNLTPHTLTRQKSSRTPLRSLHKKESAPAFRQDVPSYQHPSHGHYSQYNQNVNKNQGAKSQLKTKEAMGILYSLEEIYNQLSFQEFDAFAQERIAEARKNIERLCAYFKDEPLCYKHQDLLNLYCENCKEVICVSCVYKGNQEHKAHKVRPLETVVKSLELESIRNEEKVKGLRENLFLRQEEILDIEKEICEDFMNISNNSINIINDTIKELETMKEEYDTKLSLAYKRTGTIVKRYNESLESMISLLDSNLQKASTMKGISKYLLLKLVSQESVLIDELVAKFNENKVLMEQWRTAMKESEKIIVKKKKQKFRKEDVYVVTEF